MRKCFGSRAGDGFSLYMREPAVDISNCRGNCARHNYIHKKDGGGNMSQLERGDCCVGVTLGNTA